MTLRVPLFLALLFAGFASLAQPRRLSLAQSQAAALENNVAVKNRGLSLTSAQEGQRAAHWRYFPQVSAFGVGIYGFKDFIPAVPELLPKGINNFYLAGASAMQPIYAGGQIGVANRLANLQTAVSEVQVAAVRDSVFTETEQKYWQVVQVQEQARVLLANERYLDQLLKEMRDNLRAGLIARNDLLKVQVQRNQLRLNKLKVANARQVALLDFGLFTGLPVDTLTVLSDTLATVFNPAGLYVPPAAAAKASNSYQLLQKSVEAQRLQTKLKQGDYRPTVSAGVSAVAAGVVNRGIGSTFTPAATGVVSVPISTLWGEARHTLKQRRLAEDIAENNLANGTNQLQVGITRAWYDLSEAYQQIGLATETQAQAAENLRVSRSSYRAGLNNLSDVLDAQAAAQQAASQVVEARANFRMRLSNYKYLTNTAH